MGACIDFIVQMVLVHCNWQANTMLNVISVKNNQIELQQHDQLYTIFMCGATCWLYWIDFILCGFTVLQVSSNKLSPDSAEPLYLACLYYGICIIDLIELWQHESTAINMHVRSFKHFPWKVCVHVLILLCVWIYAMELSPDGIGPMYLTWKCYVTCVVLEKQSN